MTAPMLPDAITWTIAEPGLFFAAEDKHALTVYASPLVPDHDPMWGAVRYRLDGREYTELPSDTERDPEMMFGCGVGYTYVFES